MDFAAFAGFDTAVTAAVRSVASPALTHVLWVATLFGDAGVMTNFTVLAVVLLTALGRRRSAFVLAGLMMADPLIASALKAAFARPRPPLSGMLVGVPSDASFPSGHAMASLLCYGLLALFVVVGTGPVWRKALAVCTAMAAALLVAVSRVYLGVHWPSDVLGSWLVAAGLIGLGWGALALLDRLRGPEPPQLAMAPQGRARLAWLAALCAVILLAMLARQAGIDPLLRS